MLLFGNKKSSKLTIAIILFSCILISLVFKHDTFASYTLSVTSSGVQSIDITPIQSGTNTSIGVDNITVNTTCKSGYNFTISTSVNNNNLYLNGDINNNTSGTYLAPIDNTALSSATNAWGYYYDNNNPTTAPTTSDAFSTVPTKNNSPAIIKSPLTTPSSTNINDSFNIYYGAAVSNNFKAGIYKMVPDSSNSNNNGTIVYYTTMSEDCIPYIVHFNPTSTSTGSTLSGTGTMNDQEGYKDIASTLTPNGFTPPNGYEFKEWNTAQDGTGTPYKDETSVTNLTTPGSTVTLYAIWRIPPTPLYDKIASLVKTDSNNNPRTQTAAELRATITEPTSSNPATDTSNSGVFLYNASAFGTASDASNDYPIYYYRGILDSDLDGTSSTYGSNGNGEYYPNYVKLKFNSTETCWRIFRTTGSGGIKIIYNGLFGATTTNSCANSKWKTTHNESSSRFNSVSSNQSRYIVYSGYTYNNTYTSSSASSAPYSTIFGSNSNYSVNSSSSTIKGALQSWFSSNINNYSTDLEPSAGYCADRSAYITNTASATQIADNDILSPSNDIYFGSYRRNTVSGLTPSLNCPRNIVDLYTTTSANDGNKQLARPIATITMDEAAFSGSGNGSSTANYHYNSFLRSGVTYFVLSPGHKYDNYLYASIIDTYGSLATVHMYSSAGTRPVISLNHDTKIYSGSGTATDPWIIDED